VINEPITNCKLSGHEFSAGIQQKVPCRRDVFVEFRTKTKVIQQKVPCRRDVFVEFRAKTKTFQQKVPCHRDVFVESICP